MSKINLLKNIFVLVTFTLYFFTPSIKADERLETINDQIQLIFKDLKTLEKAVYKSSDISSSNSSSTNNLNEDVLTKHLLKLNEIEEQFRELTNRFEEINFKMDKLSNRVTKIQSDSQLRFSDLEAKGESVDTKKVLKRNHFLVQTNLKILEQHQDMKRLNYLKNKKHNLLDQLEQ